MSRFFGGVLESRTQELFPTTYLTLIAIIQSLAFSLLASEFHTHLKCLSISTSLQYAACFIIVGTVWHEYCWAAWKFAWFPGIQDAFVPFALGGLEAILIYSVGNDTLVGSGSFAIWGGLSTLFGGMAYLNTYRRSVMNDFSEDLAHKQRLDLIITFTSGILLLAVGICQSTLDFLGDSFFRTISALALLLITFGLLKTFTWALKQLQDRSRLLAKGATVVVLDEDIAGAFHDSVSVNVALRSLLDLTRSTSRLANRD